MHFYTLARPDNPLTGTDIVEDGYITAAVGPQYNLTNNTNTIQLTVGRHGYFEFNISSIPDTALVHQIRLRFYANITAAGNNNFTFRQLNVQPTTFPDNNQSNYWLWNNITSGNSYGQMQQVNESGIWYTVELQDAHNDINLTLDWFAVGVNASDPSGGGVSQIYTSEHANEPSLIIRTYNSGDYRINFTGLYYENGSRADPDYAQVTAAITGGNEQFVVNNRLYNQTEYYPTLPILWQYSLSGGGTRRIYAIGNESILLTTPDDTYATYQFTIRDYTNKLRLGDAYLEALRTINGTDYIIERGIITTGTPVPLTLVTGEVYLLRVRWGDGTYTTWGYYVTSTDTTETIILRGIGFSDQAYTINRFITVECQRPTTSTITVQYNDSRLRTTWVNITVRVRGGAIAATSNSGNNSQFVTFGGLTPSANYIVSIAGYHQDIGTWGYSKIFDASENFPNVPNLTGILTFGGIDVTQIIAYTLTIATLLTFSYQYRGRALLAAMAVASFFTYLDWLSWSWNLIWVGWIFSGFVAILAEGRT